jgi:hypothetical protein
MQLPIDSPLRVSSRVLAALALLFIIEAFAFFVRVSEDVSPFYPPGWDQVGYLFAAYRLIRDARLSGLLSALAPLFHPYAPNGVLFPVQGALGIILTGLPRAGALSINLLAFLLLQTVMYLTFRRLAGRTVAWLAIAFVLAMKSTFMWAGSIFDFRIDFFALCVLGMWCCAVIRSEVFLDRKWSLVAAGVGVWLVLSRFISIVYLGSILTVFFIGLALCWLKWRERPLRMAIVARLRNMIISGILLIVCVAPFFLINLNNMYEYYFKSMFITNEKEIRAHEFGLYSLTDHLVFYPNWLFTEHLGVPLLILMAIVIIVVLGGRVLTSGSSSLGKAFARYSFQLAFLFTTIVVPLVMLNLSIHKSPVIGGILSVPVICLALSTAAAIRWSSLQQSSDTTLGVAGWRVRGSERIGAGIAVGVTIILFLFRCSVFAPHLSRFDREAVNRLYDGILAYERVAGNPNPVFSADRVSDYLLGIALDLRAFEKYRENVEFGSGLGQSVGGLERDQAIGVLADSDVIVMTEPKGGRQLLYPMNAKIESYWRDLWDWATANRSLLMTETIDGMPHAVFVKPGVRTSVPQGAWVTSDGITLRLERQDLRRWPFLVLEGTVILGPLHGLPHPTAVNVNAVSSAIEGPALPVEISSRGSTYRIVIDGRPLIGEGPDPIAIRLTFDRFFVPKEKGISPDIRQLVLVSPTRRELSATKPQ